MLHTGLTYQKCIFFFHKGSSLCVSGYSEQYDKSQRSKRKTIFSEPLNVDPKTFAATTQNTTCNKTQGWETLICQPWNHPPPSLPPSLPENTISKAPKADQVVSARAPIQYDFHWSKNTVWHLAKSLLSLLVKHQTQRHDLLIKHIFLLQGTGPDTHSLSGERLTETSGKWSDRGYDGLHVPYHSRPGLPCHSGRS